MKVLMLVDLDHQDGRERDRDAVVQRLATELDGTYLYWIGMGESEPNCLYRVVNADEVATAEDEIADIIFDAFGKDGSTLQQHASHVASKIVAFLRGDTTEGADQ